MVSSAGEQTRVVVWYAVWATICAAAAGLLVSFVHTWFFSYVPGRSAFVQTLVSDLIAALSIAAGQGAVALVTGSILAQLGRVLRGTVLLGLILFVFDFLMDFLQMVVPTLEIGWVPDIIILAVAAIAITAWGSRKPEVTTSAT
jgi:VanZ family protein